MPPMPADPAPAGTHAVQTLRTYPAKRPRHPFAPEGERSIARAYLKAFERARRLVYVEDQYLWSGAAASFLGDQLRARPDLHLVAVVPRFPDRDGRLSGPPYRIGQQRAIEQLCQAGGDRVTFFDLEAESGWPIYVHAKVGIVDDVWMIVGSDNLNIRSWTNDSELSCAVIDERLDPREPADPGGLGDGARMLARKTRLGLWCEHLGRDRATTPTSWTPSRRSRCCGRRRRTSTPGMTADAPAHGRPVVSVTTGRARSVGGRRGGRTHCTGCSSILTAGPDRYDAPAPSDQPFGNRAATERRAEERRTPNRYYRPGHLRERTDPIRANSLTQNDGSVARPAPRVPGSLTAPNARTGAPTARGGPSTSAHDRRALRMRSMGRSRARPWPERAGYRPRTIGHWRVRRIGTWSTRLPAPLCRAFEGWCNVRQGSPMSARGLLRGVARQR